MCRQQIKSLWQANELHFLRRRKRTNAWCLFLQIHSVKSYKSKYQSLICIWICVCRQDRSLIKMLFSNLDCSLVWGRIFPFCIRIFRRKYRILIKSLVFRIQIFIFVCRRIFAFVFVFEYSNNSVEFYQGFYSNIQKVM